MIFTAFAFIASGWLLSPREDVQSYRWLHQLYCKGCLDFAQVIQFFMKKEELFQLYMPVGVSFYQVRREYETINYKQNTPLSNLRRGNPDLWQYHSIENAG